MQQLNNSLKVTFIVLVGLVLVLLGTLISGARSDVSQEITLETQNSEIVRQAIEIVWNGDNPANANKLYAPVFQWHSGIEATAAAYTLDQWLSDPNSPYRAIRQSFPDIQVTIEKIMVNGDTVAVCYSVGGTFGKELNAERVGGSAKVVPTEKEEAWDGVFMYRLADGKIVDEWWYWDTEFEGIIN
jgi:hypothetical protein